MKSTAPQKSTTSKAQHSTPFLNKAEEGSFFSQSNKAEKPFFSPHFISPQLVIWQPNNQYEQELTNAAQQGAAQQKAKPGIQCKTAPMVQRTEGDVTNYYATNAASYMRRKTADNKFPYLFKGLVKVGGAQILDPDDEFSPKEGENTTVAAGTAGTWYVNPDNSTVALFNNGSTEVWVKTSKLTGSKVKIAQNDRISISTPFDAPITGADGAIVVQVTWGSYTGYTSKSNISTRVMNTTYTTPITGGQERDPMEYEKGAYKTKSERRKSRDMYTKGAPNAVISKNTAQGLHKLPKVNNGKASTRVWNEEQQTYVPDGGKLTNGKPVVILEEVLVAEVKNGATINKWYAKVITHEGEEKWTWAGNENRTETVKGNFTMTSFMPGQLDSYSNATFKAALASVYSEEVIALLEGREGFTEKQDELFTEAQAFLTDGNAQAAVSSNVTINAEDLSLEGHTLNADLIKRIKLFHKFLVHKGLVIGSAVTASDGVRSAAEAHQWSTAYEIRQGRVPYSNLKALTDGKDLDQNQWYVAEEDDVTMEVPLSAEELASQTPGDNTQTTKTVIDEAATMEKVKTRAYTFWDGAQAAEGYSSGDNRRKPNHSRVNVSNHVYGNAIDITFPFKFNYFDPVIDALALIFGLFRAVKDASSAEHWHYERVGVMPQSETTSPAEHEAGGDAGE